MLLGQLESRKRASEREIGREKRESWRVGEREREKRGRERKREREQERERETRGRERESAREREREQDAPAGRPTAASPASTRRARWSGGARSARNTPTPTATSSSAEGPARPGPARTDPAGLGPGRAGQGGLAFRAAAAARRLPPAGESRRAAPHTHTPLGARIRVVRPGVRRKHSLRLPLCVCVCLCVCVLLVFPTSRGPARRLAVAGPRPPKPARADALCPHLRLRAAPVSES